MNIHSFIARDNASGLKIKQLGREKRVLRTPIELRAAKSGSGPGQIVGYAAKYNTLSCDLGGFFEKLAPGCFDGCMADDTRCLRNHMDDNLLGRTSSGTLELFLDEVGLGYVCELPDTATGRDTAELVRRRDMTGSSFQFNIAMDGSDWDFDGPSPLRTITRVEHLYDVAPVTNPAYEDSEVDMRSFEAAMSSRDALHVALVQRSLSIARARLRLV